MNKPGFRWQRCCYYLTSFILLLPCWYLWQALNPQFPPEWPEQHIGPFTAAPTPLDNAPPYRHDGALQKDFSVRFCESCIPRIRQAYLSVGAVAAPLPENAAGILHGSKLMQHVHAPFPVRVQASDKLWLSVQQWNGDVHSVAWPLPTEWLSRTP